MPTISLTVPKIVVVPASAEPAEKLSSPPHAAASRARRAPVSTAADVASDAASPPRVQWLTPPKRRRPTPAIATGSARSGSEAGLEAALPPPTAVALGPGSPPTQSSAAETGLTALPALLDRLQAPSLTRRVALWPAGQQQVLYDYLERLYKAEDAHSRSSSHILSMRLQRLLLQASRLPAFRLRALGVLQTALDTYGDRVIRGLDDVELALNLEQIATQPVPQATLSLALLGVGVLRLNIVRALAAHSSTLLPQLAAQEIAFFYEALLRERLGLPGFTTAPKRDFVLPERSLDMACCIAERMSADADTKRSFFEGWAPWQQLRRRQEIEPLNYLKVRVLPPPPTRRGRSCPLTSTAELDLLRPAYLGQGKDVRVFAYDALMAWYIAHGTEPETTEKLPLQALWRAVD